MIEIVLATLSGAVGYFVIGWVFFELLLGKFMSANMTKACGFKKNDEEASMLWIFISCIAYSLMLTILFTQWTDTTTLFEGLLIGSTMGGLISVMTSTYWWATSHLFSNLRPIIADVIAAVITVGFMGGTIVWALNLI